MTLSIYLYIIKQNLTEELVYKVIAKTNVKFFLFKHSISININYLKFNKIDKL